MEKTCVKLRMWVRRGEWETAVIGWVMALVIVLVIYPLFAALMALVAFGIAWAFIWVGAPVWFGVVAFEIGAICFLPRMVVEFSGDIALLISTAHGMVDDKRKIEAL